MYFFTAVWLIQFFPRGDQNGIRRKVENYVNSGRVGAFFGAFGEV